VSTTAKRCLSNFLLFDGLRDELQRDRIILVDAGRIVSIEDEAARGRYPEHDPIDLGGMTVLPGLIDAHVHLTVPLIFTPTDAALEQMQGQVELNIDNCIRAGVTTVRDVGAYPDRIIDWRNRIEAGQAAGPRILTTLSFLTSLDGVPEGVPTFDEMAARFMGGQFVERVDDPERVRQVANRLVDRGADWLKTQYTERSFQFSGLLTNLSDGCFSALMEVSRHRGVKVAMHQMERVGFRKGVELGVHTLEHCPLDDLDPRDADRFVEEGMAILPTLKVTGDYLEIEAMIDWLEGEARSIFMPEPLRQVLYSVRFLQTRPYPPANSQGKLYLDYEHFQAGYPHALKNIELIHEAGGRIGVGTDTCGTTLSFFPFYWKELWHLTRAGLSNFEALRAATSGNAEILGMGDRIGKVVPGAFADLAVVDGNPLENLEDLKNVKLVIKGGETLFDGRGA
jgi:imidazolonepropionase-like amidohydrolase